MIMDDQSNIFANVEKTRSLHCGGHLRTYHRVRRSGALVWDSASILYLNVQVGRDNSNLRYITKHCSKRAGN